MKLIDRKIIDMLDRLKSLATFGTVLQEGSFRAAAVRLGVAPSTVSYHISELERFLGAPLLNRTTRRLSPTALGEEVGRHAAAIAAACDDAFALASRHTGQLRGSLAVTCTSAVIGAGLGEAVAAFSGAHPGVEMRVDVSDAVADLGAGRFDLGLRAGRLADSALKARRIGHIRRQLVCAPAFLSAHTIAVDADMLAQRRWIRLDAMPAWRTLIAPDGQPVDVETPGNVVVGSIDAMIELALAGMGLATPPAHLVEGRLQAGSLVDPAPGWSVPPIDLHAVWPATRTDSPVRRAFLDFLLEEWAPQLA